jgi:hypothetical protein
MKYFQTCVNVALRNKTFNIKGSSLETAVHYNQFKFL